MAYQTAYRPEWASVEVTHASPPVCQHCGWQKVWHPSGERFRCSRCKNLRSHHKLSGAEWLALVDAQHGLCAICGLESRLVIDHDHSCCPENKSCEKCRRGLVCHTCNRMLGLGQDNPEVLLNAFLYLHWSHRTLD